MKRKVFRDQSARCVLIGFVERGYMSDMIGRAENSDRGFEALMKYVDEIGDSCVPLSWRCDGVNVGRWINRQRTQFKNGTLADDHRQRLADVPGGVWDPKADQWQRALGRLTSYVDVHGDASVTSAWTVDSFPLGHWVSEQRKAHVGGRLSAERHRQLERMPGWLWDAREDLWDCGFRRLVDNGTRYGTQSSRFPTSMTAFGWVTGFTSEVPRARGVLATNRELRLCPVSVKLSLATCDNANCTETKAGQDVSMMLSSP